MIARAVVRAPANNGVSECVATSGDGSFVAAPPLRARPRTFLMIRTFLGAFLVVVGGGQFTTPHIKSILFVVCGPCARIARGAVVGRGS